MLRVYCASSPTRTEYNAPVAISGRMKFVLTFQNAQTPIYVIGVCPVLGATCRDCVYSHQSLIYVFEYVYAEVAILFVYFDFNIVELVKLSQ